MTVVVLKRKRAKLQRKFRKLKYALAVFGTAIAMMGYGFMSMSSRNSNLSSSNEYTDTNKITNGENSDKKKNASHLKDETKGIKSMDMVQGGEVVNEKEDSKVVISESSSTVEDLEKEELTPKSVMKEESHIKWPSKSKSNPNPVSNTASEESIEKIPPRDLLKSFIKTTKGDGWKILDFNDDSNPHNFSCDMVDFKSSSGRPTGHRICVHTFPDVISDSIRTNGEWKDCRGLSKSWNNEVKSTARYPIYVEVGANIGSCVMEMLYSTDAPIVAFEPSPKNLYPLQKTIQALPQSYQDRVVVFPIALGATKGSDKIISASNDMGNSHIGVGMTDSGTFDSKFNIRVERVESVLKPGYNIALMKLDVSGFECEILKGMGHAFASTVQHIHFDKTDRFLHAHGCTNLLLKLRELGFHIYEGTKEIGPNANLANLGNNLEARRSHPHI